MLDNKLQATQCLSHTNTVCQVQIVIFTRECLVLFLLQNYDDVPRLSTRLQHQQLNKYSTEAETFSHILKHLRV